MCKVFVKEPPFCKDEVKSWSRSMPVIKFESYNASDVRSSQTCQKKLAGAGVRGDLAGHGARRVASISRDQSHERRRPAATLRRRGENAPELPRRFPSYPAATAAVLPATAGRKKRCRARVLSGPEYKAMA